MHNTSNSMHLIIKEIVSFYTELRENEEYLRNYLKGSTAISYMVWSKVYNPKYLVDSGEETACCKSLPTCVWAIWMYMHTSCVSYV